MKRKDRSYQKFSDISDKTKNEARKAWRTEINMTNVEIMKKYKITYKNFYKLVKIWKSVKSCGNPTRLENKEKYFDEYIKYDNIA
jgi:hypothetical protein